MEAIYYSFIFNKREPDDSTDWDLLNKIFGLHETLDNPSEPFKPMMVSGNRRSFLPKDMTPQELDILSGPLQQVVDHEFSARINDVLWLTRRDHSAARRAVTAYVASARRLEDTEHWPPSAKRYTRAFRLARQIDRRGMLPKEIAATIVERVRHYGGNDPRWLTHHLLNLLYEAREGEPLELAAIAQTAANLAEQSLNWGTQRDYLEIVAKFLLRAQDAKGAEAARVLSARSFIAEAENADAKGGGLLSHHHWEAALKAARERTSLRSEVPALRGRVAQAGRQTLTMMQSHSFGVDISDLINITKDRIRDRPLDEALFEFVSFALIDPKALREAATTQQDGVISSLFASRFFDYEGRVVAVAPSAFFPTDPGYETKVQAEMQRDAIFRRSLFARSQISSGLQVLNNEHVYDEHTLSDLLNDTPLVTGDRMPILLRGLAAGFQWDFTLAVHLLIPQMEAGLRYIAEQNGITPRNMSAAGIEEAWGFDRLLTAEGVAPILGENFTFELRSLLIGPKLRHNIAHGLVPAAVLEGTDALYAWWLALRLSLIPCAKFQAYQQTLRWESGP